MTPKTSPKVEFNSISIIIPALNEEKYIGKCLESLFAINSDNCTVEIIVIDNGSKDNTVKIARDFGTIVKIYPDLNVSALRNLGASIAKGDLLAFVDADCVVDSNWLINAIEYLQKEIDAVGSFHEIPQNANWIGRISTLIQSQKTGADINYIPSGNMLIKRKVFEDIGGFDPSLETGEDVDICRRLKEKNYRILNDPSIRSIHYGSPKNSKEMFFRELWHGKSMWHIFIKDFPNATNLKVLSFSIATLFSIIGLLIGILSLIITNETKIFLTSLLFYIIINLFVTINDYRKLKKHFLMLYLYVLIYGFARAISLFYAFFPLNSNSKKRRKIWNH